MFTVQFSTHEMSFNRKHAGSEFLLSDPPKNSYHTHRAADPPPQHTSVLTVTEEISANGSSHSPVILPTIYPQSRLEFKQKFPS